MRPDPKPRRRIVEGKTWWQAQQRRKTGKCALCRRTARTSWHHIVPRSQGGDDLAVNLIELDGGGTTGCHGKIHAGDKAVKAALRAALTEERMAYVIERKGKAWLDRVYPEAEGIV